MFFAFGDVGWRKIGACGGPPILQPRGYGVLMVGCFRGFGKSLEIDLDIMPVFPPSPGTLY